MSRYGVQAPQQGETKNLLAQKDAQLSAVDADLETGFVDYSNFDVKYNIRGGKESKFLGRIDNFLSFVCTHINQLNTADPCCFRLG